MRVCLLLLRDLWSLDWSSWFQGRFQGARKVLVRWDNPSYLN